MLERLDKILARFDEVSALLADAQVMSDPKKLRELAKEHSELEEIADKSREYKRLLNDCDGTRQLLREATEPEMKELAASELEELDRKVEQLEEEIKLLLVPRDPNDEKNAIVEIRAGTGGDEAGLFVGDLYRMYTRFAERQHWRSEVISSHPQGIGGYKEIILQLSGKEVYGSLKYEGGVHRVQRVPLTEQSGRIHTSAASVAVLPEAEEVDIAINPSELRIDVFRSSGPGGQSVNTTDSAVRITHIPSGMVVQCQDEKSQLKNKTKAMKVLRARLLEQKQSEEREKVSSARKLMVGRGDRSDKIRTYNFPQNRLTDHRIGLTLYRLEEILEGDLDEIIEQLALADRAEKLHEEV